MAVIKLYNTLTRKKEIFKPLYSDRARPPKLQRRWVGLYTCGPTVYNYAHIGNLRTYIFEDVLRHTLEYAGYKVRHVMNITDVGHLTSDADEGEDKMEREAAKGERSVWDIAKFYTEAFLRDIGELNIKQAHMLAPATQYVPQQIALIKKLFKKGYAYETEEAVYFDVSKFKNYTKLSRQKLAQKIVGARDKVVTKTNKRHPQDFALWFKRVGRFKNHIMYWNSPWGDGFPGWHIECSAISSKFLGQPFDIHTGGVDHVSVHHTNEIAQSEGALGKPLARFWIHGEFLLINRAKMAKSKGNFYTLATVTAKRVHPLAFRYLTLTAHYRTKLNFTWESLAAAEQSLERLWDFVRNIPGSRKTAKKRYTSLAPYRANFEKAIYNDLDMPKAIAEVWKLIRAVNSAKDGSAFGRKNSDRYDPNELRTLFADFDRVLGLGLTRLKKEMIPTRVLQLARAREAYRKQKAWAAADALRKEIESLGYTVKDTSKGPRVQKN